MGANKAGGTDRPEIQERNLIEIGRACGASCDDVALLVGREQTGTISDDERNELRRLRRLEVI